MKNPCDEKKKKKRKIALLQILFFVLNFIFFLNWDIPQFRLTTSVNCIVANRFCGLYLETPHKK